MTALFEGVKVLEIGQYVAAPFAAELFAHGGADVVKIEPVAGDATRYNSPVGSHEGRQYIIKARGKRGIPVDLSTPTGRAIAREMALGSDVLITNTRPGVAERLGLDHASLRADNPSLVYGQITGYGDDGPLAPRPSVDMIAQSWSGLNMSVGAVDGSGNPSHHEAFLCDYMAGVLLAFGVASALRAVALGHDGQVVSTSLAHAALVLQHRNANIIDVVDQWKRDVADWVADDGLVAAAERRRQHEPAKTFFFSSYPTADGVVGVGAVGTMARKMCDEFGIIHPEDRAEWADRRLRREVFSRTHDDFASLFATLATREVVDRLVARDIPAAPFRLVEEVLVDDDAARAGLLHAFDHPSLGPITMPAAPVSFSASDYRARDNTPALGEHTDQVLRDLGYDDDTIERLVADGIVRRQPDVESERSAEA